MFGLYANSGAQTSLKQSMKRIRRLGGTRRFWELDRLERYYSGNQHVGKASWWDGDKPARERAPCVLSGLPKAAVEQAVRFTFGEGKFATLRFASSEEPRTIAGVDVGLKKDDAAKLDDLWSEIAEQTKLKLVFREALRRGLSMRTACGVYSLRDGRLEIELLNAKNCEVQWLDAHGKRPASLECRYIFPREVEQADGTIKEVWFWYRRVIDAEWDKVFHEVEAKDGDEPTWRVDKDRSAQHGTGHAPVFWFPNLPRMDMGDADGVALIDGCEDEIDAIDYALSARHTGAFVYGNPQAYQIGVTDGHEPGADGRVAGHVDYFNTTTPDGLPGNVIGFRGTGEPARKRSAFTFWTFEDKKTDVDVGLIEASGSAAKMVTDHVTDLRSRLLESIQVVLVDPASVAGRSDMSAKLLELLYAPLLALVDDLRECWGDHLKSLAGDILRFLVVQQGAGAVVFLPSLDESISILERFELNVADGTTTWLPPKMGLAWGDYFAPTNEDIRQSVEIAKSARGAKASGSKSDGETSPLITKRRAIDFVAQYFGIEDVDAELEALDEEENEKREREEENAERELQAALTQLSAKSGAQRPGETDGDEPPESGGNSRRTQVGKDRAGKASGKSDKSSRDR